MATVEFLYEKWLRHARVPIALGIGLLSAVAFAMAAPRFASYTTEFAYAITALLIFSWSRKRIYPVLLGSFTLRNALSAGALLGALAFAIQRAFPERYCFGQPCGSPIGAQTPSLGLVGLFVIIPLCETIVMQGWLQTRISQVLGLTTGMIVTALVFIAMHFGLSAMLVVIAFALCWLRMRFGALAAVMLAHAIANVSVFALMQH